MRGEELQAIRKILMFDVKEAAELIGNVSKRSWQYWETGKTIPADIQTKIKALAKKRSSMIKVTEEIILEHGESAQVDMCYSLSYEEYKVNHNDADIIDWRLAQSVASHFYCMGLVYLSSTPH